jgi:hypothetical protein
MGKTPHPCAVELLDGTSLSCVYVTTQASFQRHCGSQRPEDFYGAKWVGPKTVRSIRESPIQLPGKLALELERNETGAGYWTFTVVFSWWRRRQYSQEFVDFLDYPARLGPRVFKLIVYHKGKRDASLLSRLDVRNCVIECPNNKEADGLSVSQLTIPAGSGVYIGAPASPMSPALVRSLADLLRRRGSGLLGRTSMSGL